MVPENACLQTTHSAGPVPSQDLEAPAAGPAKTEEHPVESAHRKSGHA